MNASLPAPSRFNPWPYGITAFLGLFVTAVALFIRFALGHPVDLVRPDYYEQEIRHQEQIDRTRRTTALGDAASIRHDPAARVAVVAIPAAHVGPEPVGTLHLYRPSDSGRDRTFPLQPDAAGRQTVPVGDLAPGLWKVRALWKAEGQEYFLEAPLVVPAPGA